MQAVPRVQTTARKMTETSAPRALMALSFSYQQTTHASVQVALASAYSNVLRACTTVAMASAGLAMQIA